MANRDVKFLLLVADGDPKPSWAQEAYRSLACHPDALTLPVVSPLARVEQWELAVGNADFVVADVSSKQPDLYYLCGFAHGRRKPTLLLVQEGHQPHFNLSAYAVHACSTKEDIEAAFELARVEVQARKDEWAETYAQDREESEARRLEAIRAAACALPRFVSRPTLETLHVALEVTPLEPESSGVGLDEVPPGRYGYSWSVDLHTRIQEHLDDVALDPVSAATAKGARAWILSAQPAMSHIGVLKALDATLFIVGAATAETTAALQRAPAGSELEVPIYAEVDEGAVSAFWARERKAEVTPIAIPAARIRRLDSRSTREGTVVDLVIDCCESAAGAAGLRQINSDLGPARS